MDLIVIHHVKREDSFAFRTDLKAYHDADYNGDSISVFLVLGTTISDSMSIVLFMVSTC
jgi:hypothetical protein